MNKMSDPGNLEKYILEHISPEDGFLTELDRETHLNVLRSRMLSGHLQGKILKMISSMVRPQKALELGTYTGYSAICLAQGMPEGSTLHTVEINDELEPIASKYIRKAGMEDRIVQHIGDACQLINELKGPFDLVFMDADKREYCEYYNRVFDKVPVGGFILADNILWSGKVAEEKPDADEQTQGILRFNDLVRNDPRVEVVIFPFRDGISVIRKISD